MCMDRPSNEAKMESEEVGVLDLLFNIRSPSMKGLLMFKVGKASTSLA